MRGMTGFLIKNFQQTWYNQFNITYIHPKYNSVVNRLSYEHTRFRKKPMHGTRYLRAEQEKEIFHFNAWDDVTWSDCQLLAAKEMVESNSVITMTEEDLRKYEDDAHKFWNSFYEIHQNRFFKDRNWLFTEFPELAPVKYSLNNPDLTDSSKYNQHSAHDVHSKQINRIFEIGCGVGNAILPILKYNTSEDLMVYGCDFSTKAIEILRDHKDYDSKRCQVFVSDATSDQWNVPFEKNSIDIIVMIFVLSSINPEKMIYVVRQCFEYLRPGGLVLFRDYGRYDMAQLRFKPGKCLQQNFYLRGDGTRAYFFTQDDVKNLFVQSGFEELHSHIDKRLQVNRGKMLKMYRVWIQAKYRKPSG